jgi:TolB protein
MAIVLVGLAATVAVFLAMLASEQPANAAFPGENGRIAFVKEAKWGANGRTAFQIFTMKPNGTDRQQLTSSRHSSFSPTWSPDGKRIVFVRFSGSDGGNYYDRAEIYTMRADGSQEARLTNNSVHDCDPAWLPDGTKIAFDSDSGIFTMNSDGSDITRLTNVPGSAPAWSPDGTKIAFVSGGYDDDLNIYADSLYVANADGSGEPSELVTYDQVDYPEYGMGNLDWSPDGQWIAFNVDDGYDGWGARIFKVRSDGTQLTALPIRDADGASPAWSPDGKQIVYDSAGFDRDNLNERVLYKMNADGTNQRRITSGIRGKGLDATWQTLH